MREETYIPAPWDNLVKSITACIFVFIIVLLVLYSSTIDNVLILGGIILLYASVLVIPYLWAPQGYFIVKKTVVVKRLIGDVAIRFIEKPRRWKWTWWGVRLFASGGLYGYFGLFSFKGIGRVWMYATNRHNLVLLKAEQGRKVVLSPKDPEDFIQLLSEAS